MRILHINSNYVGNLLHKTMKECLDSLGYQNQVFSPTFDASRSNVSASSDVCICECFNKWDRLVYDHKQNKIFKAIQKHINLSEYDLIHAYTLFTDGNCARRLSQKHRIPYVVAVRNTDVNDFFRLMPHLRKRGVQIMRDASAVFFLSEAYRRQVFEKYIPQKYQEEIKNKTHIIPNGIDDFWFENMPEQGKTIDKKHIKLVYAGRIDKNKNIPTTQKAVEILRKQGYEITFTVVGKVQDEKEFRIIKDAPHTKYLPAMPKEKLIDVYRASDIFVMPSYTESFGLVYAEAMSQGLPVIYSKGQGFDGQFAEGTVGYHVDSGSPDDVAAGIKRVVENYNQINPNCVPSSHCFTWNYICQNYSELYKKIAKG